MPHVKFTIFLLVAAECFAAAALMNLRHVHKSTAFLAAAWLILAAAIIFISIETLYYTGG